VPRSVSRALPAGVVAIAITPSDALETCVVWRGGDESATVGAFVEIASEVFAPAAGA